MAVQDGVKWFKRASFAYAFGIWSMIASYAFLKYIGRIPDMPETKPKEVEESEDPRRVVYESPYIKAVIKYKEDSVPFNTKISNVLQWFSGKPSNGDSKE